MDKVELIDRAAVIADLRAQFTAVYKDTMLRPIMDDDPFVEVLAKSEGRHMQIFLDGLEEYLKTRHAFDAVPVVRCKDCALRGQDECPMTYVEDLWVDDDGWTDVEFVAHDQTTDDGFCHMGRRADDVSDSEVD